MKAEDLLPDHIDSGEFNGLTVRKGTVGAFLINVKTWQDAGASAAVREQARADMKDAVPALYALGLLDVFVPRDPEIRSFVEQNKLG